MRPKAPTLKPEDLSLWRKVSQSVDPLNSTQRTELKKKQKKKPAITVKPEAEAEKKKQKCPPIATKASKIKQGKTEFTSGLAKIERKTRKKIAKGQIPITARLDLHGMTQAEAHANLLRFLKNARDRGDRHVLVITGKGYRSSSDQIQFTEPPRGVLRQAVPKWLSKAPFSSLVSGYEEAHLAHGGAGALYIRLKRQ